MSTVGLDIGGANIKAATCDGRALTAAFALWQRPHDLADFLRHEILAGFTGFETVALTMTGELCDCFSSKGEGVAFIIDAVRQAAGSATLRVYSLEGDFLQPGEAIDSPSRVAASNWHALAAFLGSREDLTGSLSNGIGLLLDFGSTSCDLIPFQGGQVLSLGNSDPSRIENGELVYTGSIRTPVCAVLNQARFRERQVPLAQEFFASMRDVYLVLGDFQEDPSCCQTADNRPATIDFAMQRLARMLCADRGELDDQDLVSLAHQCRDAQMGLIQKAIQLQLDRAADREIHFVLSGSGSRLLETHLEILGDQRRLNLVDRLSHSLCEAAPAYAVARRATVP